MQISQSDQKLDSISGSALAAPMPFTIGLFPLHGKGSDMLHLLQAS